MIFWLKVRKEYILDNFEDLLVYLRSAATESPTRNDDFISTLDAMEELCHDISERIAHTPLYAQLPEDIDPILSARLFGATLLAQQSIGRQCGQTLLQLVNLLYFIPSKLTNEAYKGLSNVITAAMSQLPIKRFEFSWSKLSKEEFRPPFFIHQIASTRFVEPEGEHATAYFENKGLLTVPAPSQVNFMPAYSLSHIEKVNFQSQLTVADFINVMVKNSDWERIDSFADLYRITNSMLHSQLQVKPTPMKALRTYRAGDRVSIEITEVIRKYSIAKVIGRSIDPDYAPISGEVVVRTNSHLRPSHIELRDFFEPGDILIGKVTREGNFTFDLSDTLEEAYRNYAAGKAGALVYAIFDSDYANGSQWVSETGVRIGIDNSRLELLSDSDREEFHHRKENALPIQIEVYANAPRTDEQTFFLYGNPCLDYIDDNVDFTHAEANEAMINIILDYFADQAPSMSMRRFERQPSAQGVILMARVLRKSLESTNLTPMERMKYLSVAAMLCRLADNTADYNYFALERQFLASIVDFAQGRDVRSLNIEQFGDLPNAVHYAEIIQALAKYKNPNSLLRSVSESENLTIDRVKTLVKASNEMLDILGTSELNNIKKTIAKALNVGEEYASILTDRTHYGIENIGLEFKQSIVFPPINRITGSIAQADPAVQKWAILKTICGFLNSRSGGELLLGVNDGGYAEGLDDDIRELNMRNLISEPTLDRYRNYVQNIIDYAFAEYTGSSLPTDITTLNVTYTEEVNPEGKQILRIHVKPYAYGVVKFADNQPRPSDYAESYVRRSGSTMPLSDKLKQEVAAYKLDQVVSGPLRQMITLRSAMIDKKNVILREYNSASGINDREIEVYKVWENRGLIYGFDVDKRATRVFKLSRCKSVDTTTRKWKTPRSQVDVKLDPFGMIINPDNATQIVLLLTDYAAMILCEEHPDVEIHPNNDTKTAEKYPKLLVCTVSNLDGILRFCLGMPDEVKVKAGDALQQQIIAAAHRLTDF